MGNQLSKQNVRSPMKGWLDALRIRAPLGLGLLRGFGFNRTFSPNPPKDTDGRREDSGRVGEGATGEMAGLHWGRLEVGGRSSVAA